MGFLDYYVHEDAYLALAKVQGGIAIGSVTGKTFWVDNTHPDASDVAGHGQFNAPFSTLDYAIGRCEADRGDTILVGPKHAETVATDGGITLDVDGVTVRGFGWTTFRPSFTIGTLTTASIKVTGAGCRLINLRFFGAITSLDRMVEVNADGVIISGCLFQNSAAANDANKAIEVDGDDFVTIIDNDICFLTATNPSTHAIHMPSGAAAARILGNRIFGNFSAGAILFAGNADDILIDNNRIFNLSSTGPVIDASGSTGLVSGNQGLSGFVAHDSAMVGTGVGKPENYFVTNLAYTEAGGILPATRST